MPKMLDLSSAEYGRDIPMVAFWRQNEFQKVERRADIDLLVVDAAYARRSIP